MKDTFVWKMFYKQGLERDFDKEIFFKFINFHTYVELNKSKKYGNQPTLSNLVTTICGAILKIITFFKISKLGIALSRQSVTEELLTSEFSPWVQSRNLYMMQSILSNDHYLASYIYYKRKFSKMTYEYLKRYLKSSIQLTKCQMMLRVI